MMPDHPMSDEALTAYQRGYRAGHWEGINDPGSGPQLTGEEAFSILTMVTLAQEVLVQAGIAAPDEPDAAMAKLSLIAKGGEPG